MGVTTSVLSCSVAMYTVIMIWHCRTVQQNLPLNICNSESISKHLGPFNSYLLLVVGISDLLCLLISHLVGQVFDAFVVKLQCRLTISFTVFYTRIFKSLLYTVLILRVYSSFKDVYYSKKTLVFWNSGLILWNLTNIIVFEITIETALDIDNSCIYKYWEPILLSLLGMDVVACIGNTYLFMKPMFQLRVTEKESNNNAKLLQIAIKQCILNLIVVMVSFLTVIAGFLTGHAARYISIEVLITTLCVILMFKWYSNLIKKVLNVICYCYYTRKRQIESDISKIIQGQEMPKKLEINSNSKSELNTSK
eukprot:491150_1